MCLLGEYVVATGAMLGILKILCVSSLWNHFVMIPKVIVILKEMGMGQGGGEKKGKKKTAKPKTQEELDHEFLLENTVTFRDFLRILNKVRSEEAARLRNMEDFASKFGQQ